MRKLYTLLLLVLSALLPMVAEAAPVTVQQAREKAVEFFMTGTNSRAVPTLELAWSDRSLSRGSEEAALYIFNRTDRPGFVMMAGDDAAAPVLAYSFEHAAGNLDEMPAHIRYYLDGLSEQIEALRASGAATNAAWAGELTAGTPVRELPTALWDQGEPFNRECPVMSNGQRAVTGCVQTAAAIVIKYNRWPDSFNGEVTVPGFTSNTHGLKMDARTLRSYDFDKMPDTYYQGQYTDEQAAEVARLMADLGVMDEADYGPETGAFYSRLEWALGEYMRYSKQASYVSRASYSDDEWATLIKKEIDANRPLLYDGHRTGGHAFVLDGYDTENYFRFNWGWGGQLNGYFVVKNLTPGNFNFSDDQGAIINLIPDKQGTTVHNHNLELFKGTLTNDETINGLAVDTETILPKTPFNAQIICCNASQLPYVGKLAIVVASKEGQVKEVISSEITKQFNGQTMENGYVSFDAEYVTFPDCEIKQPLFPGARVRVAYWEEGINNWSLMGAKDEGVTYQIQLVPDELTPESVAEVTKISYNRTTKKLSVVVAPANIQVSLLDSSSKSLGGGMSSGEPVVIDLQSAAKGSYSLVLTLESGKTHTTKLIF